MEWLANRLGLTLASQPQWNLKLWKTFSYQSGGCDLEESQWLSIHMEGTLRKDRESTWMLGRNMDSSNYLLAYCQIEGQREIREKLAKVIWTYLNIRVKMHNSQAHRLDPLSLDSLKADLAGILQMSDEFAKLSRISIVFSLLLPGANSVESGQFGPHRPITFGRIESIIPENNAIVKFQYGGYLRFWKVVSEFGEMSPLFLGTETGLLPRGTQEALQSTIASEIARSGANIPTPAQLAAAVRTNLKGLAPRCFLIVQIKPRRWQLSS
jgi:hypothetical protein